MKSSVLNIRGEKQQEYELPKQMFEVSWNSDLVHQVAVAQLANQRQNIAHVKDRGEVRGGGKKPWRQKGTGRARHGSIRSPLWVGGGVTHGPTKERNFKKSLNKKMRRAALFAVLSEKLRRDLLIVVDSLQLEKPKTKLLQEILQSLPIKKNTLLVLSKLDKNVLTASKNLPTVRTIQARELRALDLLQADKVILPKDAVPVLKETFGI
tara:strand:+ start:5571 stop:6197 length:627 start_codon:yes stop_codon:yes gene_type:complete